MLKQIGIALYSMRRNLQYGIPFLPIPFAPHQLLGLGLRKFILNLYFIMLDL